MKSTKTWFRTIERGKVREMKLYITYFGSVSDQSLFVFFFQLHSSRMSHFLLSVVWPSWANTKWVRQMWMHEFQWNNSVRRLAGFMFTKRREKNATSPHLHIETLIILFFFSFSAFWFMTWVLSSENRIRCFTWSNENIPCSKFSN